MALARRVAKPEDEKVEGSDESPAPDTSSETEPAVSEDSESSVRHFVERTHWMKQFWEAGDLVEVKEKSVVALSGSKAGTEINVKKAEMASLMDVTKSGKPKVVISKKEDMKAGTYRIRKEAGSILRDKKQYAYPDTINLSDAEAIEFFELIEPVPVED